MEWRPRRAASGVRPAPAVGVVVHAGRDAEALASSSARRRTRASPASARVAYTTPAPTSTGPGQRDAHAGSRSAAVAPPAVRADRAASDLQRGSGPLVSTSIVYRCQWSRLARRGRAPRCARGSAPESAATRGRSRGDGQQPGRRPPREGLRRTPATSPASIRSPDRAHGDVDVRPGRVHGARTMRETRCSRATRRSSSPLQVSR